MISYGISIYPDFESIEAIKQKLDQAKQLGYQRIFTSLQLGDLGFENTEIGLNERFQFLFEYAKDLGFIIHADINKTMLLHLGATVSNLEAIHQLSIQVLRLDAGFSAEELVIMTQNPWGIIIEDNASSFLEIHSRTNKILEEGNIHQYYACHNFYPLVDTGLGYQEVFDISAYYHNQGVKNGVFISSLYSSNELNSIGKGVGTIELQRNKPSHIQAMELKVGGSFDYIFFGDSNPSLSELKRVSEVLDKAVVDLPVWFDTSLDKEVKHILTHTPFTSRQDHPEKVLRATQSRDLVRMKPYQPINRSKYAITINNHLANRYTGEIQIPLMDLPAREYLNVIGQIKPQAEYLIHLLQKTSHPFQLTEE